MALIFCLSSNRKNLELLNKVLKSQGFEMLGGSSIAEIDSALNSRAPIKTVLLDITGFEKDLREKCDQLRLRSIPFIILLPKVKAEIFAQALSYGASGLLMKPVAIKELLALLRSITEDKNGKNTVNPRKSTKLKTSG